MALGNFTYRKTGATLPVVLCAPLGGVTAPPSASQSEHSQEWFQSWGNLRDFLSRFLIFGRLSDVLEPILGALRGTRGRTEYLFMDPLLVWHSTARDLQFNLYEVVQLLDLISALLRYLAHSSIGAAEAGLTALKSLVDLLGS